MKALKFILGSIYPILILLLLLFNMKSCHSNESGEHVDSHADSTRTGPPVEQSDTTRTEPPVEQSDTTRVVHEAEQTGGSGNLKVTLLWNFEGDIDLHVNQPNGKEIYYRRKTDDSTGGALDVDNQEGGSGSAENIYWADPPKGEYLVSLVYYQESTLTGRAEAGSCKVVVFQEGKEPQVYTTEMSEVKESKNVVKIKIQ